MKAQAFNHPKILMVARDLRMEPYAARGLVASIWMVAAVHFLDGLLVWDPDELALAIGYSDDAEKMIAVLIKRKLLDQVDAGLYIHDWHEHCEDSVHMKLARKGVKFANGMIPSMSRLSAAERERAARLFVDQDFLNGPLALEASNQEVPDPVPHEIQNEPTVRTNEENERTAAHTSALPIPIPIPRPFKEEETISVKKEIRGETLEEFPADFRSERLAEAWADWKRHRNHAGLLAVTDVSIAKMVIKAKAHGLGPDDLAKIVAGAVISNSRSIPDWAIEKFKNGSAKPTASQNYQRLQEQTRHLK